MVIYKWIYSGRSLKKAKLEQTGHLYKKKINNKKKGKGLRLNKIAKRKYDTRQNA